MISLAESRRLSSRPLCLLSLFVFSIKQLLEDGSVRRPRANPNNRSAAISRRGTSVRRFSEIRPEILVPARIPPRPATSRKVLVSRRPISPALPAISFHRDRCLTIKPAPVCLRFSRCLSQSELTARRPLTSPPRRPLITL